MIRAKLLPTAAVALLASLATACAPAADAQPFDGPMVLALTWQPAFCEGRRRLPECRSQRAGRFDEQNFTLHGLWPGPRGVSYCDVSAEEKRLDERRQWARLPGLGLSDALRERLYEAMPGVRSFLHRHEWVKHGTCYGTDAQAYFTDSLALLDVVNASPVRALFARSIGRRINSRAIRDAVAEQFGREAANRVSVHCKRDGGRTLITELRFSIRGRIGGDPALGRLLSNGRSVRQGCDGGIVDPVGYQ